MYSLSEDNTQYSKNNQEFLDRDEKVLKLVKEFERENDEEYQKKKSSGNDSGMLDQLSLACQNSISQEE